MNVTHDPRTTTAYAWMNSIIEALELEGPMTIDELCDDQGMSFSRFRSVRYSLAGRMALDDRGMVIPRPVSSEGYVYKLASTIQSANPADDGEPNLQQASSDLLTRTATIYTDVERLVNIVPRRTTIHRVLRKLQKQLDSTLDRTEDVASEVGAPVSAWAQHVLDRLA